MWRLVTLPPEPFHQVAGYKNTESVLAILTAFYAPVTEAMGRMVMDQLATLRLAEISGKSILNHIAKIAELSKLSQELGTYSVVEYKRDFDGNESHTFLHVMIHQQLQVTKQKFPSKT